MKLDEKQRLRVSKSGPIKITDAKYTSFGDVASQIGGFNNFIMMIFGGISGLFFTMFLNHVAIKIQEESSSDMDKSLGVIIDKIKERLSYLGLYYLFDRVEE